MISFTSSIRRQLLCWLLFPIIALIVIDTAFANIFGMEIANDAYDESLIDSANAIAEHKIQRFFYPHTSGTALRLRSF